MLRAVTRGLGVLGIILLGSGCSDAFGQGSVTFCMQWVNTSPFEVTFTATDDVGDVKSVVTLASPGIGDAFASPKVQISGAAPITFSANANFSSVTFKPSGGNKVLIVEAAQNASKLQHYEDNGQCP